jgi:hypothetical protein
MTQDTITARLRETTYRDPETGEAVMRVTTMIDSRGEITMTATTEVENESV